MKKPEKPNLKPQHISWIKGGENRAIFFRVEPGIDNMVGLECGYLNTNTGKSIALVSSIVQELNEAEIRSIYDDMWREYSNGD